jgi:hypothetical protein
LLAPAIHQLRSQQKLHFEFTSGWQRCTTSV